MSRQGEASTSQRTAPVGKVVGPGDVLMCVPESGQLRLGPGVSTQEEVVVAAKTGVLKQARTGQLWVEGRQKRYIPAEGEVVVGVILDRHAEHFVVDINAPFTALLPQLSFEGATRRNRPNLKAGDIVYARVVQTSRDMDPVLSCVDTLGRAAGFGQLKDGILVNCTTALSKKLLASPPAPVLTALGASVQFELAVGMNGRLWVCAPTAVATIAVADVLSRSEQLTEKQVKTFVARVVESLQ